MKNTLVWAYWWLPVLNVLALMACFLILLGVSEQLRMIFPQVFHLPDSVVHFSALEIFSVDMAAFLLPLLLLWYLSFVVYTLPAPVVRFAVLRKPMPAGLLSILSALLCFALGAVFHMAFFGFSQDTGPYLIGRIPSYATMLFAFSAAHSLLCCQSSSSDERPAQGHETYVSPLRAQNVPPPPPRLTYSDPLPGSQGGSGWGSFGALGNEDLAGSIITGSAHFGAGGAGQLTASAPRAPETFGEGVCFLCGTGVLDSQSVTLPDGRKVHRQCHDEAAVKLSTLKSNEETRELFMSSPDLMKAAFRMGAEQSEKQP